MTLSVRLLGPVDLFVGERRVPLEGIKQRAIVAMLALEAGNVVSVERLIDGIWGDTPPSSVRSSLQVHVAQIRRLVTAAGASHRLTTRRPGYLLEVAPDDVDALRLARRLQAAHRMLHHGRPAESIELLRPHVRTITAEPLAGLESTGFVGPARRMLDTQWLDAAEVYFTAELECGPTERTVAALERLSALHPYRESIWELLARTLYLTGRQTEALTTLSVVRTSLRDDLGLDPSPSLAQLELAILHHDPCLRPRVTAPVHADEYSTSRHVRRATTSLVGATGGLDAESAAALFVERARSSNSELDGQRVDRDAIHGICALLDGIPLAIELAAARTFAMTPRELFDRLTERFEYHRERGHPMRTLDDTMQLTLAWSYELLADHERRVLEQLSVFRGGFDLQAIEEVVDLGRRAVGTAPSVLALVENLVAKSMITASASDGVTRLAMCETVRQFAADRLDARGGTEAARRRHTTHLDRMLHVGATPIHAPREDRTLTFVLSHGTAG